MSRRGILAMIIAVVGVGLVIFQAVQTLRGDVLSTGAEIMLWAGLGGFVIGAVIMITDGAGKEVSDRS